MVLLACTKMSAPPSSGLMNPNPRCSSQAQRSLSIPWQKPPSKRSRQILLPHNASRSDGIFGCRDRAPKSPLKCANVGRDQNPRSEWPEIPAETPYSESYRKRAVCEDWMVETEGTELPTPHPVIEPVSDIRVRNGNFRDGSVKTAVRLLETDTETLLW